MPPTRNRPAFGWRQFAGTALALGLLALLVLGLDTGALAAALASAEPALVGGAVAAALAAQFVWSLTTVTVLSRPGDGLVRHRIQLGYLSGTFGKQVLPLGTISGTAVMAYVISEDADRRFGDVFAAVAASELLIFGSSLAVAALGLFGLAVVPAPGLDSPLLLAVAVGIGGTLAVGVALVAYRRAALGRAVVALAGVVHRLVGPVSGRVANLVDPDRVAPTVDSFLAEFEATTGDQRRIAVATSLAVAGWLAIGVALYCGLAAVGVTIPLVFTLFLAPASGLATLLPTPGGLGGAELGLTVAFVVLTGVSAEQAAAGVLLYRFATYWLVVSIGGLATVYLSSSVWRALE